MFFEKVPKKFAVIGGGYIGLELGSVWKRLGADVTVIEFSDTLVPTMDKDIAKIFHSTLTKQGINFMLSTKVEGALNKKEKVQINCLNLLNNKSEILDFDKVLVAVGRKPFTDGLGLENLNIKINHSKMVEGTTPPPRTYTMIDRFRWHYQRHPTHYHCHPFVN